MSTALYEAAKQYVIAANRVITEQCHDLGPETWVGMDEWVRESSDVFVARDHVEPALLHCLRFKERELHALPEYAAFQAALQADPDAAGQVDALVGTAWGNRRVEAHDMVQYPLRALARRTTDLATWPALFDEVFQEFEAALRLRDFDYCMVSPLLGLQLEEWPMSLQNGLELDRLDDNEIAGLLRIDALPTRPPPAARTRYIGDPIGVRARYREPKRITAPQQQEQEEATFSESRLEAQKLGQEVLEALRVYRKGDVTTAGYLHYCRQWPMEGGLSFTYTSPGRFAWAKKYELRDDDLRAFPQFWQRYRIAKERAYLASALRRFGLAGERENIDDRLVDLMIAAESLFLSGIGDEANRGELTYRLSMRAAFFVEVPGYSRHDIYRFLTRAYRVRSAVVHGGAPNAADLRGNDGQQLTLQQFTEATESILRIALHNAIEKNQPRIDWERLITAQV
jgi:hypothetical protein